MYSITNYKVVALNRIRISSLPFSFSKQNLIIFESHLSNSIYKHLKCKHKILFSCKVHNNLKNLYGRRPAPFKSVNKISHSIVAAPCIMQTEKNTFGYLWKRQCSVFFNGESFGPKRDIVFRHLCDEKRIVYQKR